MYVAPNAYFHSDGISKLGSVELVVESAVPLPTSSNKSCGISKPGRPEPLKAIALGPNTCSSSFLI